MDLTPEQQSYLQKGKKYRIYDDFGNHWDTIIQKVRYHPEGYLWVEYLSMKNDSGVWLEDGNRLDDLIYEIEEGKRIETF